MHTVDVGFTRVAFTVHCLTGSIDFYIRYTAMTVIHQRKPGLPSACKVAWFSDHTRPPALMLAQSDDPADTPLGPFGHLGVACATQAGTDEKVAQAWWESVLRREPEQLGDSVGYFAFSTNPDGNTLELSWGQWVGLEVITAGNASQPAPRANIFHRLVGEGLHFKRVSWQHEAWRWVIRRTVTRPARR